MKKVLAVKLFFENSFPFLGKSQNEKKKRRGAGTPQITAYFMASF
jgi:hypothetical protein